jgi:hypothetical protein
VLALQRKSLPADHPDIAKTLGNLGWELIELDKHAEAEPLFREAVTIQQHSPGPDHWITANSRRGVGVSLIGQGRFAEAETELLAAERIFATAQGVSPKRYATCLRNLVTLYAAWEKAEPGKGHDRSARAWQAKLPATRPATSTSPSR